MIHHTRFEDLNGCIWNLRLEYAFFPKIQEVVITTPDKEIQPQFTGTSMFQAAVQSVSQEKKISL